MTAHINPQQPIPGGLAEIGRGLSDSEVETVTRGKIKKRTLQYWRLIGEGPKFFKIGRRCYYHPDAIAEFVEQGGLGR